MDVVTAGYYPARVFSAWPFCRYHKQKAGLVSSQQTVSSMDAAAKPPWMDTRRVCVELTNPALYMGAALPYS
jgi:hypothetical protein